MPRHVPSSFQTLMNLYQNCMHVARCGCSTHPKLRVIGYGRRQRADVHQQNLALPCSQSKIWAFCLVQPVSEPLEPAWLLLQKAFDLCWGCPQ